MDTNQVMVKMVLERWFTSIERCDRVLNSTTDEQLQREIMPGKNRGVYLLGHLIAVHDDMMPVLEFGNKLFPELYEPFIVNPDKAINPIPAIKELRICWNKQNEILNQKFDNLQNYQWFEKHASVSAENFEKEPHRNKLNILIGRTNHLSYHSGQLAFLK